MQDFSNSFPTILLFFRHTSVLLPSAFSETTFCLPSVTNSHPFDISYVCAWYSLQWKPKIENRYPVPKVSGAALCTRQRIHFSFCQNKMFFCSDLVNSRSSSSLSILSIHKSAKVFLRVSFCQRIPREDHNQLILVTGIAYVAKAWKSLSLQPERFTVLQTLLKHTSISHTVTVGDVQLGSVPSTLLGTLQGWKYLNKKCCWTFVTHFMAWL